MTNIFSFIGEHSLWLCPDLLEAIVKQFGNESDWEKLREYQDDSLEPYLRKSIKDIRCKLVMAPTAKEYVKLEVKIPNAVLGKVDITGHTLLDVQRKLIEFLRRPLGAMKLISLRPGCIKLTFILAKEEMEDIQSDKSLSEAIAWDSKTESFQFELKNNMVHLPSVEHICKCITTYNGLMNNTQYV